MQAQDFRLYLHFQDKDSTSVHRFFDIEEAKYFIDTSFKSLIQKGFLSASVDSLYESDTTAHCFVYLGRKYTWTKIYTDSLPSDIKRIADKVLANELKNNQSLKTEQITTPILDYADHQGFPFAELVFEDVHMDSIGGLIGTLKFQPGQRYRIDSIRVHYQGNLSNSFLFNYLDIHHGMEYSGKKLSTISPLIATLPYLREEKPWELKFGVNDNTLDLYLKQKKANQANALIGLQPSVNPDKRFDLTADVLLFLQNELGYGEQFRFAYKQLQQGSPRMDVSLSWPYLLGTPFGADLGFNYQRFDTSFRKTLGHIGLRYQLSATNYIRVFAESQGNRVITFDTAYVRRNKQLPPNTDVKSTEVGFGLHWDKQDNPLNPYRGFVVELSATGVSRKVLPNNAIDYIQDGSGFNYGSLYADNVRATYQARIQASAAGYIPIWQALTLKMGYEGAYLSGDGLFRNELFQIGGFKILRGFNELSIFSQHYHVATLEPRLLVGQGSNIYLFTDIAYLQTLDFNNQSVRMPALSFGLGGTLSTESGVFNITFGLGRQGHERLELRNTRVHFGYSIFF